VHKLLTRPRRAFVGFQVGRHDVPNRTESEHDFIENSHASTGLTMLGDAEADDGSRGGRVIVVVAPAP